MKLEEKKKMLLGLKNKVAAYMLISGLAGSALLTGCSNKISEEDKDKVESVYGLESDELTILTYVELSNKLKELKLDKYDVKIDNAILDTPENIEVGIENLNIKYLKEQEQCVNSYLRTEGYNTARDASLNALKSYVKETLGLSQSDEIEIKITTSGEEPFSISVFVNDEHISLNYSLDSLAFDAVENYLETNVETGEDKNDLDNNKYNKDRNEIISNTLIDSSNLEEYVKERDLANPKLIKKLNK